MNFVRLAILYVHLISCCVAVGVILINDIRFMRELWAGTRSPQAADMEAVETAVTRSLVALWLSGLALISVDVAASGLGYFGNPKLQAKLGIAVLLTVNGALLHAVVLPAVKQAGNLFDLTPASRLLAVFSGAVSGVSWGYAAMLGIARPLSWKYSLVELLAAYPVLILAAFLLLTTMAARASNRGGAPGPASAQRRANSNGLFASSGMR